jgi:hypothetical protein
MGSPGKQPISISLTDISKSVNSLIMPDWPGNKSDNVLAVFLTVVIQR